MNNKKVNFHYDSAAGKITMHFSGNLVITNDDQTETIGPTINVLGYGPDSIPIVAAKECLEEMLALVNAAMEAE